MSKTRNNQESMICLTPKTTPPQFPKLVSLWPPSSHATSHPNIGSLKSAIKEEWNKVSEELILKACKSFQMCVNTIIEKNGGHIE